MRFGEVAEGLLRLAADTTPGQHDDAHEALLEALREWLAANGDDHAGERHDSDVRMVALLLAAIDGANMPARDSGLAWMAQVLSQLAGGQRACGDAWRELTLRYMLKRLAGHSADFGGLACWAWEAMAASGTSPAVAGALQRAARSGAEAHGALREALAAVDAASGEWAIDAGGPSA